jgi:GNAT superfamily N-acetyltransferase
MVVIAVLPTHIRRGIGGALLEKVETWLFNEGCSSLWLTTDVEHSIASILVLQRARLARLED